MQTGWYKWAGVVAKAKPRTKSESALALLAKWGKEFGEMLDSNDCGADTNFTEMLVNRAQQRENPH